jgi:formate/nitrite transporter
MSGLYIAIGGTLALTAGGGIQPQVLVTTVNGTVLSETQIKVPILSRLLVASVFPVALMLIVFMGGELYTGNVMMMIMGMLSKKVTILDLAKSWSIALVSNYIGVVIGALAIWGTGLLQSDPYHAFIISVCESKVNEGFGVNLLKGIPCNILVCSAICLAAAAEDVTGKILGIWWPIFTFALSGFEHCIANMFFVTLGIFLGGGDFGYGTFLWQNLLPVIIGNTIGGGLFVAVTQWYLYYDTARPPVNTAMWDDTSTRSRYSASPVINRRVQSDKEIAMEFRGNDRKEAIN